MIDLSAIGANRKPQGTSTATSRSNDEGAIDFVRLDPAEQVEAIHHIPVEDIAVRDRFRQDLGDLDALAQDIDRRGLLSPVLLQRNGTKPPFELIDGERRLRACRDRLGRKTVEARLLDLDDLTGGQIAANTLQKGFSLSERVAIGLAVEVRLGERRGGDHGNQYVGGKRQDLDGCHGRRTDAVAAERAGFGNRQTYRNARQIVLAARQEPDKYGRLVERMDRSGKVDGAFRELSVMQRGEKALTKPVVPDVAHGRRQCSTIICGDSLVEIDLLDAESADLILTSPPYYNARPEYSRYESYTQYLGFMRTIIRKCHRILADGRCFVMVVASVVAARKRRKDEPVRLPIPFDLHQILADEGFVLVDDIIWLKPEGAGGQRGTNFARNRSPLAYKPMPIAEYVLVYREKSQKLTDDLIAAVDPAVLQASKIGDGYERTNVWRIPPARSEVHPAPFPLELADRVVRYYSFVGELVLEPVCRLGDHWACRAEPRAAVLPDREDARVPDGTPAGVPRRRAEGVLRNRHLIAEDGERTGHRRSCEQILRALLESVAADPLSSW